MATSPVGREPAGATAADPRIPDDATVRSSGIGRTAILLMVLVAIGLSLALPLREFSDQRSRITELTASNAAATSTIAELTAAKARWNDPAFVMAQARQRLHLVMPGQTAFIVVEDDTDAKAQAAAAANTTWYQSLWSRVTGLVGR